MTESGQATAARERARAREIFDALGAAFPDARCELDYSNAWQLLIATVLSAQTTDVRVNQITKELFAHWPDNAALAHADPHDVAQVVRPLGFGARRAEHITTLAAQLAERWDGRVPPDRDALVALKGVGRKTSHVVLSEAFGIPELAVDTHVLRTSRRLGLTTADDPLAVERDLVGQFDRVDLPQLSHRLIFLGRRVCHARNPECARCPVVRLCPSAQAKPDPAGARD
ncbi:endonuclease III [Rarobacter faecitabidus]|uniref:Endonuclease III n=1 Tax=Rarobacter faecitabidus TaxID=13243 RepID=A0A542ZTR1_RARFA|nr:endonuclease III [Rarobacter faecitabidus]TQL63600.1 DNA-(apurinic or apyrimidinic site) lyase /endonuclease III [Rarobacter faecitabidus]